MILLIHNWDTYHSYNKQNSTDSVTKIYTECPSVYERLKGEYNIHDISEFITLDDANTLGVQVFELSKKWQKIITENCSYYIPDMDFGEILGKNLLMLMNSLVYHYSLLQQLAEYENETVLVPYLNSPKNLLDSTELKELQSMQTNWYGLIAQTNLLNNVRSLVLKDCSQPTVVDKKINIFDAINSFLLRLTSSNLFFFEKVVLNKTLILSLYNNYLADSSKKTVHIFLRNDLIYSLMLKLLRRRHRVINVSKVSLESIDTDVDHHDIGVLTQLLDITDQKFLDPLSIAAKRVEYYINKILIPMYINLNEIYLKSSNKNNGILLTNSLGSPIETLQAYFYRKQNIPVVSSQHGATGLLVLYKYLQHYSSMKRCDYFICFNDYEIEQYIENNDKSDKNIFFTYGVSKHYKSFFSIISRYVVRKMWGIGRKEKVVLYAPTRFKEGQVMPYDNYDMKYWDFMKNIVDGALKRSDATNIIKIHQKGLSSHKEKDVYANRKNPWLDMELSQNIKVQSYPQLNYSRYAADILIIDRATSTLDWAISSGVPLIYIDNIYSPLSSNLKDKISKAVFFIDACVDGWENVLLDTVNMSEKKIKQKWVYMKEYRDKFIDDYVLGSVKNSSNDVLEWLSTRETV